MSTHRDVSPGQVGAYLEESATSRDLSLLAKLVGVLYLSTPALAFVANPLSDVTSIAAAGLAVLPVAVRFRRVQRMAVAALVFCALYAVSALTTEPRSQGLSHTLAAIVTTFALLLFASYGREMLATRWFRVSAWIAVIGGASAALLGDLPKNATSGIVLYLSAFAATSMVARSRRSGWPVVLGFFAVTAALALLMDFRSLVGYSAVLVLSFAASLVLSRRAFWFVGLVGSLTVIAATLWYFTSIYTSELANSITAIVAEESGRRAASGREWLWPAILEAVHGHEVTGLGAGVLPRDFLDTDLSSHNYYLQVYLQLGWIGIIALGALLLAVWTRLSKARSVVGRFGAAIFLMLVAHNATEVIMFQNTLIAAIPAWCAIGLAIALGQAPPAGGTSQVAKKSTARRSMPERVSG